jgi:hypothetical protein
VEKRKETSDALVYVAVSRLKAGGAPGGYAHDFVDLHPSDYASNGSVNIRRAIGVM